MDNEPRCPFAGFGPVLGAWLYPKGYELRRRFSGLSTASSFMPFNDWIAARHPGGLPALKHRNPSFPVLRPTWFN